MGSPDASDGRCLPSSPAVVMLAYLLVADGRAIAATSLADRCWPDAPEERRTKLLGDAIQALRAGQVCIVDTVRGRLKGPPVGYFLTGLPPDDLLELVLSVVHQLRAAGLTKHVERWPKIQVTPDATKPAPCEEHRSELRG